MAEGLDKNFTIKTEKTGNEKTYYKIPNENFDMYGIIYDETIKQFVRLPDAIAKGVSGGVDYHSKHTAGGRLRFKTNSKTFHLSIKCPYVQKMSHMALTGQAGFVLFKETDGEDRLMSIFPAKFNETEGFVYDYPWLSGEMTEYILYFPLYNPVSELVIGLDADAIVTHGKQYRDIDPILYYGSSITQGGCASRPDNSYESLIGKWNNIDYINLGFSGNGKAEQSMCEYLATIKCSLFVCDYDYNAPDPAYLRKTHYNLYEVFRKAQPTTPILFVSKPDYDYDPTSEERIQIILETIAKAKANGDNNVYFLSGRDLYGEEDRIQCAVDSCHPNDLGFYKIAKCMYKKMIEIDAKFE